MSATLGRSTDAQYERVCSIVLALAVLSCACRGIDQDRAQSERTADSLLIARSNAPLLVAEWSTQLNYRAGGGEDVKDFHAGYGLAAVMRASSEIWIFTLHDSGRMVAGGPTRPTDERAFAQTGPSRSTRLLGIESDARVWLLDAESGALSLQDVGGNVTSMGRIRMRGAVTDACLARGDHVYFIEERAADSLMEQRLDASATGPLVAMRLPPPRRGSADRSRVRLAGGTGTDCALVESKRDSFYVIASDASLEGHPYIEELGSGGIRVGLKRRMSEWRSPPESALDLSVSEDIIAVLFGGRSSSAKRIVDFYRWNGSFLASARLPAPAIRIALAHGRLYALSRRGGRLHLSSFVLPPSVRHAAPLEVPMGEARVPRASVVGDSVP